MSFGSFLKKVGTIIATPVVAIGNAVASGFDGDKYVAAMDKYFENGFDQVPSIDKRNKDIDKIINFSRLAHLPAEAEVEKQNQKIRLKEFLEEQKNSPETQKKRAIKEEAKKQAEEQAKNVKILHKKVEELTQEKAKMAAKEKEAREKGDLTTANNYRARINGNLSELRSLKNELARKSKSQQEIEAQLTEAVKKSQQGLANHLN